MWKRGDPMVWLTGGSLAVCLFMIITVVGIILVNGLAFFWPREVTLTTMKDGAKHLAIFRQAETVPPGLARDQGLTRNPHRRMVMVANRDFYSQDFVWINDQDIVAQEKPSEVWVLDRHEYGPFIGFVRALQEGDRRLEGEAASAALSSAIRRTQKIWREIYRVERVQIGRVNALLEKARLDTLRAERETGPARGRRLRDLGERTASLQREYETLVARVTKLREEGARHTVTLADIQGTAKTLGLLGVIEGWQPNRMGVVGKAGHYLKGLWTFLADNPREANTEGGIFPALFGTAMMVILMSLAVVPFGVLTAFYLCEYATQGPFVRAVRIALNNLAGVPSIVYGVFGLGFFVYFLGGSIDRLFYPEVLPTPTWGTGGILWASLTLALLTVPVVVMATEESISAVPRGMREGSLALGASKFQTLIRILLPASLPGILTGVILAMARGAGEVAPLMITGVVKLAPSLPVDGISPFLHLERKFMHLGFHIYDVGFQSPNVEASRPMVFTTALLLILLVIALNLGAILLRDLMRRRYATGAFN
ncbi:MAG: phosphate ABC transporter permease PstA [Verrucomicrobiia bacterium]